MFGIEWLTPWVIAGLGVIYFLGILFVKFIIGYLRGKVDQRAMLRSEQKTMLMFFWPISLPLVTFFVLVQFLSDKAEELGLWLSTRL